MTRKTARRPVHALCRNGARTVHSPFTQNQRLGDLA